jgi:hypothetical protein
MNSHSTSLSTPSVAATALAAQRLLNDPALLTKIVDAVTMVIAQHDHTVTRAQISSTANPVDDNTACSRCTAQSESDSEFEYTPEELNSESKSHSKSKSESESDHRREEEEEMMPGCCNELSDDEQQIECKYDCLDRVYLSSDFSDEIESGTMDESEARARIEEEDPLLNGDWDNEQVVKITYDEWWSGVNSIGNWATIARYTANSDGGDSKIYVYDKGTIPPCDRFVKE